MYLFNKEETTMPVISRRIPCNLVAKIEGKTKIQPNIDRPEIFDIKKSGKQIKLVYHDPTFKPTVYAQPNNCITTIVIKPCTWFKNSFKIASIKQRWESGAGIFFPGPKEFEAKSLISKRAATKWIKDVLNSLK